MNYETARNDLSNFVRTIWEAAVTAAGHAGAPLAYDNLNFTPPQDGEPWGRLTVKFATGTRASLGSGSSASFRRGGALSLQVFTKIGSSTLTDDRIADNVVEALEDAGAVGVIWFRDVRKEDIGPDRSYHQSNIVVDFVFDR